MGDFEEIDKMTKSEEYLLWQLFWKCVTLLLFTFISGAIIIYLKMIQAYGEYPIVNANYTIACPDTPQTYTFTDEKGGTVLKVNTSKKKGVHTSLDETGN